MSKRKVIAKTLRKHQFARYKSITGENSHTVWCYCGWKKETAIQEDSAEELRKHQARRIVKALKKAKQKDDIFYSVPATPWVTRSII